MRLRLQTKYSLVVVGLLIAMIGLLVGAHLVELRNTFGATSRSFTEVMTSALFGQVKKQGEGLGRLLAASVTDPLYRLEVSRVQDLIRAARRQEGVLFVAVFDENRNLVGAAPGNAAKRGPALDSEIVRQGMAEGRIVSTSDGSTLHVVAPVIIGQRTIGCIKLGLSLAEISNDIELIRSTVSDVMHANEDRFIAVYIGIAVMTAMVGFGLTLWMVRGIVHPIHELSRYTRRIGAGNYDEPPPVQRSDELGDLARSLGEMAKDLKQVAQVARLATLGEMAVGMAHELSQPLNTIRLAAENALMAIEGGKSSGKMEKNKLLLISRQAESMGDLIRRMCVVGRSEGPQDVIDPRESVRDAYSLLAGQYEDEGITVTLDLPDDCPVVMGRRNELGQVIINLLSNAHDAIIESALARKARLGPTAGRIEVSMQAVVHDDRGKEVLIRVKDNGGGVPPDVVDRIFDPFFTTKEVTKGTGLGLSISYGIVNAMGGRISVEDFGGGALFTVQLPTVEPNQEKE